MVSSPDSISTLLGDLQMAEIGTTFNPYRECEPTLDRPDAPEIRTLNLARHLESRSEPRILLVGEAAGYNGCRFSGIAFTSERSLPPQLRTSLDPRGRTEHSATILQRVLRDLGIEEQTLLWNVCPTHPHKESPLSNRTPRAREIAAGRVYLDRLVALLRPSLIVAVGRHAAAALPGQAAVRHPANGGAGRFRAELAALVAATARPASVALGPASEGDLEFLPSVGERR